MPYIASPLGSTWRRWDLHVHTPESLVHNYGGTNPWDRFLEELAHLPPDLSVIGINDYLFVEGYKKVLAEFQSGRLPNLEAIFPVIELRLNQFAGSEGEFRRVNYHVIFEREFDAETISAQFINGLSAHYKLAEGVSDTWEGFPTRENLTALGARIRATTPDEKKSSLESSDLLLGFSNLVVGIDHIEALLKNPVFAGKTLTAIGKAEWESMRWSGGGIASKKDLVNRADVVFTAAESPTAYERARTSLTTQGVNDRLLDCGDAHNWSDSDDKDRLGNCSTWISAQPTL